MAHSWSTAGSLVTLTLDGTETGQVSRSRTFTGLTPSVLHTFYMLVNPSVAAVEAFIEVDGGDRTTATVTGSQSLRVRGTTNGSGEITLRFGAAEVGAVPGTLLLDDDLNYATIADYVTAGWTTVTTGGGSLSVESDPALTDGQAHVLKASVHNSGTAYITKTFTVTPSVALNLKGWSRNDVDRGWDTSTRIDFSPGPTASNRFATWDQEDLNTTPSGTSIAVKVGRMGGFFGIGGTYYGLFSRITLDDGSAPGGGTVTFNTLTYCEGSGTGDGGTGLGGDPDTPGEEPIPDPPPDGYPPPVTGGARLFGTWDIPVDGLGFWNGGPKHCTPTNTDNLVNDAGTADCFFAFIAGARSDWMSGGRFSFDRWRIYFDSILDNPTARNALEDGITSGVIPFHYVLDEPDVDSPRYGGAVPFTTVERMCMYSKSLGAPFDTWPTCIGVSPDRSWMVRHMVGLDWMFRDYSLNRGDITTWISANQTRATALGHVFAPGIHYLGFDRPKDLPGDTERVITPSEFRHYGGIVARLQGTPFFWGWKWIARVTSQPGWWDAHHYVRDLFASNDP